MSGQIYLFIDFLAYSQVSAIYLLSCYKRSGTGTFLIATINDFIKSLRSHYL